MAPNTPLSTRALIVCLKSPFVGKSTSEIAKETGLSARTINSIYARAIERGFEPNEPLRIDDRFLVDAPRSGRPRKEVAENLIQKVRRDRYGREKSCADLAGDLSQEGIDVSATTVWRILKKAGFKKTKPTRKPGLTQKMREERLQWCKDHEHWTLEDWMNVIWSDETSVVLLHRRGGYRIWRKADEAVVRSCIRERWKGYSEFMFWGCFSYEKKGPCHCWKPETKKEKEYSIKKINEMNELLEPILKEEWELLNGIRRMDLRKKPGRAPKWQWNEKNGKLIRGKGTGIDWWRYQSQILIPKLIPFAKECMKDRPQTLVQEDKAPSHAHHAQAILYSREEVERLL
jgi:transposase